MAWRVERAEGCVADLEAIADFLIESYREFGDDLATAVERAGARVRSIDAAVEALGRAPHQGTLRPELGEGIRNVTKDRAVLYFELDEATECVRVLAIFFGGQDHRRRMLLRALGQGG